MAQGVAMGYEANLGGWYPETVFANDSYTTMDVGGTPNDFNGFGHVVEFNFDVSAERQHIRGLGAQKRKYDPIVSESFELSASFLWQYDASNDTIKDLISNILTNEGNSRNSFCIQLKAEPDGSTAEYLYLLGCTVSNFSIALALDDTIKVEITFNVADIDDGGSSPSRDWGSTDIGGTPPTNSTADPTTFSQASITTWGIAPSIITQLQDLSVEWNCNPILIKNYTSKSHINQAQGAIEISFSGSAFGDGTSMGASALIDAILSDSSGNIVVSLDGTNTLTLTACSYDSVGVPVAEADLTIIDFDGQANNLGLA